MSATRPAAAKAMGMISGIGIAYDRPRGAHRLTGTRAPDLELGEGRLYELLRKGEFVLVTPGTGTSAEAAGPRAIPTVPGNVVRAHWASGRGDSLLIRPDGYIAWAEDGR